MNAHDALEQAIKGTEHIVADIEPGSFHEQTPCTDWDVHQLLNHLLGDMWTLEAKLTGNAPRYLQAPGSLPNEDIVSELPSGAYKEAGEALREAARDREALERENILAAAITTDILVHGWDLAKATGHKAKFDDDLAAHCLTFVRQGITDQNRAPAFAPEVEAARRSSVMDKLVAYLGRTPR